MIIDASGLLDRKTEDECKPEEEKYILAKVG